MAAQRSRLLLSSVGNVWGPVTKALKRCLAMGKGPTFQQRVNRLHCNYGGPSALRAKVEPGEPLNQRPVPEYIPQRKAKNPMKKICVAWAIGFPSGILLFLFAKREVDKKRLEKLKVHQRMKASNEGEYESGRYRKQTD